MVSKIFIKSTRIFFTVLLALFLTSSMSYAEDGWYAGKCRKLPIGSQERVNCMKGAANEYVNSDPEKRQQMRIENRQYNFKGFCSYYNSLPPDQQVLYLEQRNENIANLSAEEKQNLSEFFAYQQSKGVDPGLLLDKCIRGEY